MNSHPAWTSEKWHETVATILRRATTDAAFRQKCLCDPHGVIKEIAGLELQPDAPVRFIEASPEIVISLPPFRPATGELSDQALERVAGGSYGSFDTKFVC